ncbi:MAG: hypothetical protein DRK00_02275 [Thermoprotei archaeon]|nr:MAG: hypothetical protein DRK00_02275 [Thermoprotei archaeon]
MRIERGQLVKVEDGGRKYILRVFDFRPESLLTPAEIAVASRMVEAGESVRLYDGGLRLYDTALATILCQIDEEGRVQGPTSVPRLFTYIESLEEEDLSLLKLDTGGLFIGYIRVGHRPSEALVSLDGSKVVPHHILVCGVTGAGKSNLGKVLAAAVMLAPPCYSLVIFDCESEYLLGSEPGKYGLAHLPAAEERLFVVTPRVEEPSRLRLRLEVGGEEVVREILAHPLKVDITTLHPYDFTMTGEFTEPQEELLWLAYRNLGKEWLVTLLNADVKSIYRRLGTLASVTTISVTKRKLRHLLGSRDVFVDSAPTDLFKAVLGAVYRGMVVLFDMPFTTEGEEKLLTIAVARRIFHMYERMRKQFPLEWEKLPYVLIMVEEAHRYLSKQALSGGELRENIFTIIAKRGRKYKVGGLYITQMPGELTEAIIRQALTKIVLSLPTKPDLTRVIQYSPYLDEAEQEIRTLDRGEALLVSPPSGIRFAVPIKIFNFEKLVEQLVSKQEARAWAELRH